ncbi:aminodeoxychorismate synthase component I [Acidithiobacillus acidisediminis]|uniref:aminodeoxychorismate synthase component I n=1 Tax=Acidithiobacillus acidisediminis TaxID=2937799 RepID=UPI002010BB28
MQRREIGYVADSATLVARFAAETWTIFLDSGLAPSPRRQIDLLLRQPRMWIWEDAAGIWTQRPGATARQSSGSLFDCLRAALKQAQSGGQNEVFPLLSGFLSYDWGVRQELGRGMAAERPLAVFALYDHGLLQDHDQQRAWIHGDDAAQEDWLAALAHRPAHGIFTLREPGITPRWSYADYATAFARVQGYIRAGDCYQINLAQDFTGTWDGDPWTLYAQLRGKSRAPFSVFFRHPWGALLSVSPERLLRLQDGRLEARPIKGTRRRGSNPQEDRALTEELLRSEKDRAENLMIVDLLRNDLGKVARPGSVCVPELFGLESYDQVHHLVSSIEADLAPAWDAWDALAAAFPGGSITGAPKRRAMEIIEELEHGARGLYCGSFGYVTVDGAMDWNILIRSLELRDDGSLIFQGGGAVVADSDCAAEYAECLSKVAILRSTVEEFLPQTVGCARVAP